MLVPRREPKAGGVIVLVPSVTFEGREDADPGAFAAAALDALAAYLLTNGCNRDEAVERFAEALDRAEADAA